MSSTPVTLNVTGTQFKVSAGTFEKLRLLSPESRTMLDECVLPEPKGEVFLERHPACFEALLHLCVHGELHMPPVVCPQVFRNEMQSWGIKLSRLENCCYSTMITVLENHVAVAEFEADNREEISEDFGEKGFRWQVARNRMWNMLERPSSSGWAKVYFCAVVVFTLFSLFTFIASTHSAFLRNLKKSEWEDYLGDDFSDYEDFLTKRNVIDDEEDNVSNLSQTTAGGNVSLKYLSEEELSNIRARVAFLDYVDYVTVTFFTLDFVLRLLLCPGLTNARLNVFTALDLVALVAMYATLLVDKVLPKEHYTTSALDSIDGLQIFRLVRIFRLLRDVMGFKVLFHSVKSSLHELLLLVMFLSSGVLLFSFLAYWCDRSAMKSLPDACWWAIITMTTVGYGDIYPITFQGKVVGSMCAVSGVLLIAVTVPVVVNNFLLFYSYSKVVSARAKEDQVHTEDNLTCSQTIGGSNKIHVLPQSSNKAKPHNNTSKAANVVVDVG